VAVGTAKVPVLQINSNMQPINVAKVGKFAVSVKAGVRKTTGSKDSNEARIVKAPKTKFLVKMRQPVKQPTIVNPKERNFMNQITSPRTVSPSSQKEQYTAEKKPEVQKAKVISSSKSS